MSAPRTRVALVTGANRGIGFETSRQLAQQGVTVLMGGRDEAAITAAAKTLAADGHTVLPTVLDITDDAQIEAVRAKIEADFGRLDILVNNAGVISGESFFANNARTVTREGLRQTFEINFFGTIALTQALLPLIEKAPAGRIVNVSSVLGSITANRDWAGDFAELGGLKPAAYNASKAALNMYTVDLAHALRDTAIKVNAAHPGWVKTELGTDAAPMEVDDGAKTSVALALLADDGPTGAFYHLGQELPW